MHSILYNASTYLCAKVRIIYININKYIYIIDDIWCTNFINNYNY